MAALCYVVCALIWSTTWFAIRVCIDEGGYPTYAAAAIRFTIAALILLAIVWIALRREWPRSRRQLAALAAAGLFNGISYACVYRAEESLPGGLVSVIFGTYPLFTALVVSVTGTERVKPIDLGAAALSLIGISILFWDRMEVSPAQAVGIGFGIAAVLASVIYNVIMKREAGGIHPIASTAGFLSVASAVLWVPALIEGPSRIPLPPPLAPTVALLYLALLGSVVAFVCFFYMLRRVSLMTASTLVLVQPVIALLVDALWEDEVRLVLRSYAGAAVTLTGVLLAIAWKWRASRRVAV